MWPVNSVQLTSKELQNIVTHVFSINLSNSVEGEYNEKVFFFGPGCSILLLLVLYPFY